MSQKLTLLELEDSKTYVSEKNTVFNFKHPMDYLSPVLEIFQGLESDLELQGVVGSVNREKVEIVDGIEMPALENISYSRVLAKAKLKSNFDITLPIESDFSELTSELGFVFGLDTANPEIKVYSGKRVTVCSNGCIFGADAVTSFNLLKSSNTSKIYDTLKSYAEGVVSAREEYIQRIERMHNNKLSGSKLLARIGHILWEVKRNPKIGITVGTEMLSLLQSPKTRYGIDEDSVISDWHLYNACTETIKKTSILDEASKCQLLDKVFHYN